MERPKLLDLFCKAGGASMGYFRAGFDVTGVDLEPQPRYPFAFVQADALEFVAAHGPNFDVIHASPPCQGYIQTGFRRKHRHPHRDHPRLIAATRTALTATGRVWVLENVESAIAVMRLPVRLCGTSFGLPLRRHRLFESSIGLLRLACRHERFSDAKYPTNWRPKSGVIPRARCVQVYGNSGDASIWPAAMGIDWMTRQELTQAVPPAYTEFLGRQLLMAYEEVP